MDVLVDARKELLSRLLTEAPPGYKVRVCILIALWILLFLQSFSFVIMSYKENRRLGRSMKLIRLQKTARGNMISVQANYVFAIATVVMSVLACIRQGIIYRCYFEGADRYMETLFYVLMLTGAVWGAAAYTFSHLNATILLFDNTANNERTKKIWIPVYNVMFVVFPLVWLGVIVSQGVRIVVSGKRMFRAAKMVLPLLDSVIANPNQITVPMLGQLRTLQDTIYSNLSIVVSQRKGLCILAIVYSGIFALVGTAGVCLIHILRTSARNNTRLLYASHTRRGSTAVTGQTRFALPGRGTPVENKAGESPLSLTAIISRAQQQPQPQSMDEESNALHKLLRNLQTSVPLCLLLTVYFPVSLAILYVYGTDAGWRWEEFRNDIFAWPWSIIMNIIFAAFHINAWMGKKCYGLNSTSSAGVRSDSQPRGLKTDQISAGQHILNIQLECAYPPTLSKDSEVIGEALDDAAEQQQKQESHEKQRYPWD